MLFYKKQVVQRRNNTKLAIASNMKIDILPSKFQLPKAEKQDPTLPLKVGLHDNTPC